MFLRLLHHSIHSNLSCVVFENLNSFYQVYAVILTFTQILVDDVAQKVDKMCTYCTS